MHAPFDRSREGDHTTSSSHSSRFLIIPVLIAIVLITLTIVSPKSSIWISQAVQAEFGGIGIADDMPKEPHMQIRSVQAF